LKNEEFCDKSFSLESLQNYNFFEIFQVNLNVQKGKTM